jgi:hypothetical protein
MKVRESSYNNRGNETTKLLVIVAFTLHMYRSHASNITSKGWGKVDVCLVGTERERKSESRSIMVNKREREREREWTRDAEVKSVGRT